MSRVSAATNRLQSPQLGPTLAVMLAATEPKPLNYRSAAVAEATLATSEDPALQQLTARGGEHSVRNAFNCRPNLRTVPRDSCDLRYLRPSSTPERAETHTPPLHYALY